MRNNSKELYLDSFILNIMPVEYHAQPNGSAWERMGAHGSAWKKISQMKESNRYLIDGMHLFSAF